MYIVKKVFLIALLITSITSATLAESIPKRVLELKPSIGNTRNSEGALIRTLDGKMLFAYSRFTSGKGYDEDAADIATCISTNEGKTWEKQDTLAVHHADTVLNVMSVSLLELKASRLALFYLVKQSAQECYPVMRISSDGGKTWGEPKNLLPKSARGFYVVCNDRTVRLSSGRILLPVSREISAQNRRIPPSASFCLYSDDEGVTWHSGQEVSAIGYDGQLIALQEPLVVELKDGRVWMLMRTEFGAQYASFSTNKGETFSPPKRTPICSPRAPASLKRLSTGDLLLVWNDISDIPSPDIFDDTKTWLRRNRLRVAISGDDGQTWKHKKWLENDPNGWFCYTAIFESKEHVFLAYNTTGRLNGLCIRRIPLGWFYAEHKEEMMEISK